MISIQDQEDKDAYEIFKEQRDQIEQINLERAAYQKQKEE